LASRFLLHTRLNTHGREGGRLDRQPAPISLGLLPSGPDPVGEGYVCRQSPTPNIAETRRDKSPLYALPADDCG